MPNLTADFEVLFIPYCFLAGLFLLALVRIGFLMRTNRRLAAHAENMEKQVVHQQLEMVGIRRDSNAWRGALQVQFDTFRAEASRRLEDSEMRYDQAARLQERQFGELKSALAQALQKGPEPHVFVPPASAPASVPMSPTAPGIEAEMVLPKIEEMPEPAAAE